MEVKRCDWWSGRGVLMGRDEREREGRCRFGRKLDGYVKQNII